MYTTNKVYRNCVFPGSSFLGGGGGIKTNQKINKNTF